MTDKEAFKKLSILVIVGILGILSVLIIWPIASAIVFGLVLSYVFYPIYKKILKKFKEKNISALSVILLLIIVVFIPLWFLFPILVKQVFDIYLFLQNMNVLEIFRSIFPSLARTEFTVDFANSFNNFISTLAGKVFSSFSSILLDLPEFLLKLAIILFVFFYGMRDADVLFKYVKSLSPFSKSTEQEITKKFKDITNSVIYGFIIIGIIQGILTGIGLFIFGVPQVLILTIVAIIASMIPILGSWLVWLPAAVYLLLSGNILLGIGLIIYGSVIISWVDNIIRPYLVARKVKISSGIVLIGMIGGFLIFGILGFILGPLIFSYLLLFIEAYRNNKFPDLFYKRG